MPQNQPQGMQNQQNMQQGSQSQPQFTFEGGHLVMYHQQTGNLPKVKDPSFNDRDRMQDLLAQEKHLSDTYNTALLEASHDGLYQVWQQNQDECQQLERQVFNLMFQNGWYKLPVADAQAVSHAYNQFEQYKTQFPFPAQIQGIAGMGGTTGTH
ncbi:MAG: spore coat protein [Mycobacterium leprae]